VVNGSVLSVRGAAVNCQLISSTQSQCTSDKLASGAQLSLAVIIEGVPQSIVSINVSVDNDRKDDNTANNQASAETNIDSERKNSGSMTLFILFLLAALVLYRSRKMYNRKE